MVCIVKTFQCILLMIKYIVNDQIYSKCITGVISNQRTKTPSVYWEDQGKQQKQGQCAVTEKIGFLGGCWEVDAYD